MQDKNLFETEEINEKEKIEKIIKDIKTKKECIYYLGTSKEPSYGLLNKKALNISIVLDKVYYFKIETLDTFVKYFKEIFEDDSILKIRI